MRTSFVPAAGLVAFVGFMTVLSVIAPSALAHACKAGGDYLEEGCNPNGGGMDCGEDDGEAHVHIHAKPWSPDTKCCQAPTDNNIGEDQVIIGCRRDGESSCFLTREEEFHGGVQHPHFKEYCYDDEGEESVTTVG